MQEIHKNVYVKENFLTPEECNAIIDKVKGNIGRCRVADDGISDVRTSLEASFPNEYDKNITSKIRNFIESFTKLPIKNQERMAVLNYQIGQLYKPHHDCYIGNLTNKGAAEFLKQGGQRPYTCLIYLNQGYQGGETNFPKINVKIKPEIGKLLVFRNQENGSINTELIHESVPVTSGQKWCMTVWVREHEFK